MADASAPSTSAPSPTATSTGSSALENGVAYLTMDVNEDGGLRPGYELKLNSYDLGVDIELADAVQRLRFEHPEVGAVVITQPARPHLLLRRQHLHAGLSHATTTR